MDRVDQLIATIYAAAADTRRWQTVVDQLHAAYGSSGTAIVGFDYASDVVLELCIAGWPPGSLKDYTQHYAGLSPTFPALMKHAVGEALDSRSLLPWDQFCKTEYYNDFLKPNGFGAGSVVSFYRNEQRQLHMSVDLPSAASEECKADCQQTLQRLVPHVRQSFDLMRQLRADGLGRANIGHMLNLLPEAAILIDAFGTILAVNEPAERELRSGVFAGVDAKKLCIANPDAHNQLQRSLSALRQHHFGDVKLKLPIIVASGCCTAAICPLAPQELSPGDIFKDFRDLTAFAVVMLTDRRVNAAKAHGVWSSFSLTRAEGKLARAIASGVELRDYAETQQLSIHTVRNQLKSIFSKTGTQRQTQLAILLNQIAPSPLQPGLDS